MDAAGAAALSNATKAVALANALAEKQATAAIVHGKDLQYLQEKGGKSGMTSVVRSPIMSFQALRLGNPSFLSPGKCMQGNSNALGLRATNGSSR